MKASQADLNYGDYLRLDKLLSAQAPRQPDAHDEMLFIVVHQAYELWFKQILHELKSVQTTLDVDTIAERSLGMIAARLLRITRIQQLLIEQIGVLETMTPLDFLDFRDALTPASGFQSVQFREIEIRLGMYPDLASAGVGPRGIFTRLKSEQQAHLVAVAKGNCLLTLIDRWLARMPFLHYGHYDFWQSYRACTEQMLASDRRSLQDHPHLSEGDRQLQLEGLEQSHRRFDALFNSDSYQQLLQSQQVRLSQQALLAALFIHLYRDEPILQLPFQILTRLVEIDEQLSTWRYRHMIMVQRMLGNKIGTGGSAGHNYLKQTLDQPGVFDDLFNLSTYLIPRSKLPPLPAPLRRDLDFHFSVPAFSAARAAENGD